MFPYFSHDDHTKTRSGPKPKLAKDLQLTASDARSETTLGPTRVVPTGTVDWVWAVLMWQVAKILAAAENCCLFHGGTGDEPVDRMRFSQDFQGEQQKSIRFHNIFWSTKY